ncbi:MAG: phage holin family protein [Bacteroidales bacterium]|nr:phage holin family protein [Bacteroidales bacterium]
MDELFCNTGALFKVAVVVMLLVLLAMIIDLGAGLYKAKQRGELRTSEALRRTLSKFISYEGGLTIAVMVDVLINFAKVYELFRLEVLTVVPVVTILVGIFLLVVEFMSVREKADAKTKKQQEKAAELIGKLITREDLAAILRAALDSREMPKAGQEVDDGEV